MHFAANPRCDIAIVGAGVIGLSLALELRSRGCDVAVFEQGTPMAQASSAAAGMLAVHDPHNPPELLPLAVYSRSLYSKFLARIEALSGESVPFQTETTWQTYSDGTIGRLQEHSIDPRQLAAALLKAVEAAGVRLEQHVPQGSFPHPQLSSGAAGPVVFTTGAWGVQGLPVSPRKGQMLRVRVPSDCSLQEVFRTEAVYVVPRTCGPQAGTALIGATVEDAGFDTSTTAAALASLRERGAALLPALGDAFAAPAVEAWAGLRPTTPDGLPILGSWPEETSRRREGLAGPRYLATGHFRNGILLAPGTAAVLADLIEGRKPCVDLQPFSSGRFSPYVAASDPLAIPSGDIRSLHRDNRFSNLT